MGHYISPNFEKVMRGFVESDLVCAKIAVLFLALYCHSSVDAWLFSGKAISFKSASNTTTVKYLEFGSTPQFF